VLSGNQSDNDTCLNVLRSGFSDLGYREGQTHSLEIRWADGRGDFSRLARDLVKPDYSVTYVPGCSEKKRTPFLLEF
jgi:hypothetical protein